MLARPVRIRLVELLVGVALAGGWFPAQAQERVFRSGVREVQVQVVAKDRQGNAVFDLKRGEFRVFDGGKPQRITYFAIHTREAAQARGGSQLAPNTFSNRVAYKGGLPRRLTAIVIDAYNSGFTDQHYAVKHAAEALRETALDERVGVYRLSATGIHVVHDFTSDTASLLRRLEESQGLASMPAEERAAGPLVELQALRDGDAQGGDFLERRVRLLQTLGALRAIAGHLSQLPGRKGLVWLSSGFPIRIVTDNLTDWRRGMKEINDANVAIYAIDASGLRTQPGYSAGVATTRNLPQPRATRANANNDVLKLAADETGGRAFENTNDLSKAIQQAMDDGEVVYTLGYSPDHERWDGGFRRIRVEADRKGVQLRYRNGYFARENAGYEVTEREEALRLASVSPLEATGIGLTVQVRNKASGDVNQAALTIVGSPESLTLRAEEGRWKGGFDVRVAQTTAEGVELASFTNEVTLNMEEGRYQRMLREGFVVTETVTLEPAATELRISVCDHLSGTVGSVFVPLSSVKGPAEN